MPFSHTHQVFKSECMHLLTSSRWRQWFVNEQMGCYLSLKCAVHLWARNGLALKPFRANKPPTTKPNLVLDNFWVGAHVGGTIGHWLTLFSIFVTAS